MIKTWDLISKSSDLTNYTYFCGKTRVCTKIAAIFQNGRHFGKWRKILWARVIFEIRGP